MFVRDAMTADVLSVRPETPLKEVARVLVDGAFSGLPVVGEDGRVLGVVSEADFLVKEQGPAAVRHRRLAAFLGESNETRARLHKVAAATAGEAMTSPAITVGPGSRLVEAAATMTRLGIKRLPVVEAGRLVGILTRSDLVRAYLRTDEELRATIRDDVLLRILWLDPSAFEVSVTDGVARIAGHVERRSTASMVEETIRLVPGVAAVEATISWSVDDRELQPASRAAVFPFGP